ncbi:aspartyl-phosphate phosphatase Spo0E family protein [Halalkalibacterium ligniniphilum]|uniref:aspartyl-phosphate phosphatase Spo0E family protein n=1 Tax=Halalkalibacterium ligniniphilum TaxID=1134413 RepID=UPI00034DB7A8|nr:aspartyl-phosphate phosphatase Spo0E family protein [Halalkalibacterium ligniniphilum]
MSNSINYEACIHRIESLREKMIAAAKQYGLGHPLVLKYSQELDRAHNIILNSHPDETSSWEQLAL